jgi:hypothetical protein
MRRAWLWAAAALALLPGCDDDDDDDSAAPPPPPSEVEFADQFNAGFPSTNWIVIEGFPILDENRGSEPPGLSLGQLQRSRIAGDFRFSTQEPVDFSLALSTPGFLTETATRFKVLVLQDDEAGGEASFEVRLDEGVIRFSILGAEEDFDFFTDAEFRTLSFTVEEGVARWSIDGQPFMERREFPVGRYRVEVEADAVMTGGFVIDNVIVSKPPQ